MSGTQPPYPRKLLLRIHAANLPKVGLLNALPDTFAVVTSVESSPSSGAPNNQVKTIEWGTTEVIFKHSHPQWTETFQFDYVEGEKKPLFVEIKRVTGKKKDQEISLGRLSCDVGEIFNSKNKTKAKRLANGGVIFCRLEELPADVIGTVIHLELAAKGLDVGLKRKPDTLLEIKKRHNQASRMAWITVHRSEVISSSYNPDWDAMEIPLDTLCNGDLDRPLRFAIVASKGNPRDLPLAECETNLAAFLKGTSTGCGMFLHLSKDISNNGREAGVLVVSNAQIIDKQNLDMNISPVAPQDWQNLPLSICDDDVPAVQPTRTNIFGAQGASVLNHGLNDCSSDDDINANVGAYDAVVDWCWKETPVQMKLHSTDMVVGDPKDCWVRYKPSETNALEVAFQNQGGTGECSPLPGYTVDFETMTQTKTSTGYKREIQRIMRESESINCAISAFADDATDDQVIWCWRETASRVPMHKPSMVMGDPADCWIKYSAEASQKLEMTFQVIGRKASCSPLKGYIVDFSTMKQTKESTGYEREVQRFIASTTQIQETKKKLTNDFTWCWKETPVRMNMHELSKVVGDPKDCWIRYDTAANDILESAFQKKGQKSSCSPLKGYKVDFATMKQIKTSTGYERDVQRIPNTI